MKEAKWLACTDPLTMLAFARGWPGVGRIILRSLLSPLGVRFGPPRYRGSDRKLRLFGCACCRRLWPLLTDECCRKAVEAVERYVDEPACAEDLGTAGEEVEHVGFAIPETEQGRRSAAWAVESLIRWESFAPKRTLWVEDLVADFAASAIRHSSPGGRKIQHKEAQAHCGLLRCIFGNPFRPMPTIDPAWLAWNNGTVLKLAQAIYEERRFADLPILADALEEAGCDHADILTHCRGGGEHVRGCWVVDLLLGKE